MLNWISLQDNDSYAYREYPLLTENQRVHQAIVPDMSGAVRAGGRCMGCGEILDKWAAPPPSLVVKNTKLDISITYDGIVVGSKRLKSAYDGLGLSGLTFRGLPGHPSFYMIDADRAVTFDAERRKTRFIKQCPLCGKFESVVGATPVFLRAGAEVAADEFVRTDLAFGTGDEKHPVLICGETAGRLCDAKIRGFDLVAIKDAVVPNH